MAGRKPEGVGKARTRRGGRVRAGSRRHHASLAGELRNDYHGHVVRVGVAELKAKLSAYLRRAQQGETIVVLDRDAPVAVLAPCTEPRLKPLRFTPAKTPFGSAPLGPPLPKMDVDGALAEERRDRL